MTAYVNARVFTGEEVLTNQAVLVENGLIHSLVPESKLPFGVERVDLNGADLLPAFVDIQVYGGHSTLFVKDLSYESLQDTVDANAPDGVMGVVPTLHSASIERILTAIDVTKSWVESGRKGVLGLHIEGPFINPVKRGAHSASIVRVPTREEIELIIERSRGLRTIMTIAPEVWPADVLQRLNDSDIIVSVGHTNATFAQLTSYFKNQGKQPFLATHLYNAMRGFESREPGVPGAIFDAPNVHASIIADGFHCDFAAIRMAKKLLNERLFLISDAVGVHCTYERVELGEFNANYKGDHFVNDEGKLAGSAITLLDAVRNCVTHCDIERAEAYRMSSTYPAAHLGLGHRLGKIKPGFVANMVAINADWQVTQLIY